MNPLRTSLTRCFGTLRQPSFQVRGLATAVQGVESLPSNLVFEEGEIDVTDEVMRMLERDDQFAKSLRNPPSTDLTYLPISSLASENPTLPSADDVAVPLAPKVFQQPMRKDILHRCVVYYLSLLRQGTASTKTRAEVNKSGRKLYRQKGTGKARVGDAGSGTRRGGGTIHGPHPRDFAQALPRKMQQLGLHVALSSKLNSGLLRVVQDLTEANWINTQSARLALSDVSAKAAAFGDSASKGMLEEEVEEADAQEVEVAVPAGPVAKFGPASDLSILFVYGPSVSRDGVAAKELDDKMYRFVRNMPGVDVLSVEDLQAYEVLRRKWTVLDASSVEYLAERAGQADVFEQDPAMLEELEEVVDFERAL